MSKGIITLITDFGLKDHFVGVMKGVIKNINPDVDIVDISHGIPAHDIPRAALMLRDSYRYFPAGTVHVVVVDPGVGSERKPIAVEALGHRFVGPDNGVFTYIYDEAPEYRVFGISNAEYMLRDISSTFHGRDIFSPVAAHLSKGLSPEELGAELSTVVTFTVNRPLIDGDVIRGRVNYIDGFGNLATNIPDRLLNEGVVVEVCGVEIEGIKSSYGDVGKGELLAVIGGAGYLEISANSARASEVLGLGDEESGKIEVVVKLRK